MSDFFCQICERRPAHHIDWYLVERCPVYEDRMRDPEWDWLIHFDFCPAHMHLHRCEDCETVVVADSHLEHFGGVPCAMAGPLTVAMFDHVHEDDEPN